MDSILYGSFFIGAVFCFICGYELCRMNYQKHIRNLHQMLDARADLINAQEKKIEEQKHALNARDSVIKTKDELLDAYRVDRDKLRKERDTLRKSRDKLDADYAAVTEDRYQLSEECDSLRKERDELKAELAKVNDPETQRVVQMRKQMQQDHAAFNLLCNYGTELAYGQVSPQDMMGVKEGKAE